MTHSWGSKVPTLLLDNLCWRQRWHWQISNVRCWFYRIRSQYIRDDAKWKRSRKELKQEKKLAHHAKNRSSPSTSGSEKSTSESSSDNSSASSFSSLGLSLQEGRKTSPAFKNQKSLLNRLLVGEIDSDSSEENMLDSNSSKDPKVKEKTANPPLDSKRKVNTGSSNSTQHKKKKCQS